MEASHRNECASREEEAPKARSAAAAASVLERPARDKAAAAAAALRAAAADRAARAEADAAARDARHAADALLAARASIDAIGGAMAKTRGLGTNEKLERNLLKATPSRLRSCRLQLPSGADRCSHAMGRGAAPLAPTPGPSCISFGLCKAVAT